MKGYTHEIDKLEDVPNNILDDLISSIEMDVTRAIKENSEIAFLDSPYEDYTVGYCMFYKPLDRFYTFHIDIVAKPTDGYQMVNATPKNFNHFYWKMQSAAWCWDDLPQMERRFKEGRGFFQFL